MKTFIKSIKSLNDLFCVFEDDGETGYLYIYSPIKRKIFLDLIIYQKESNSLHPTKKDIQLVYENNSNHCGVYVWNKLRGYVVLPDLKRERLRFSSPDDPGIKDTVLPDEFIENKHEDKNSSIIEDIFIVDRQNYWKKISQNLENNNMVKIKKIQEIAPMLKDSFVDEELSEDMVNEYLEFTKKIKMTKNLFSKYLFGNSHDSKIIKAELKNNILKIELSDIATRVFAEVLIDKLNLKIDKNKLIFPVELVFKGIKDVSLNIVKEDGAIISIDDFNVIENTDYLYDQLIFFDKDKIELAIVIWDNSGKYDKQLLLLINAEHLEVVEKQHQAWSDIFSNKFDELYNSFNAEREEKGFLADRSMVENFVDKNSN